MQPPAMGELLGRQRQPAAELGDVDEPMRGGLLMDLQELLPRNVDVVTERGRSPK